eukprot:CAMPEP_0116824034 /NCGR_PEP_ID=MMETSP0418-20121206/1173_1 /TAXON_ID=1158023 /ORGANISM="Astrosyne radiata, Strain 13vi08-1A" /LENGTH=69 /DNA_ID=CAMNT_0004452361 /DNA_START=85 /DNA_END=294 /DNA_ORIENTATION=+
MPVPKRRRPTGTARLMAIPSMALKLLDINFVFQHSRLVILYGFAPAVVVVGMLTEPCPASWFDIINILE